MKIRSVQYNETPAFRVVDTLAVESSVPPIFVDPAEPTPGEFSLLPFFTSNEATGVLGTGEVVWTDRLGDNHMAAVKNRNFEHRYIHDGWIYLGLDTSMNNTEGYILTENAHWGDPGATYGAKWLPVKMSVGDVVSTDTFVTHIDKETGRITAKKGHTVDCRRFESFYPNFERNGVQFGNVMRYGWYKQHPDQGGKLIETYWYSDRFGFCGWHDDLIRQEVPSSRRFNMMNTPYINLDNALPSKPISPVDPQKEVLDKIEEHFHALRGLIEELANG